MPNEPENGRLSRKAPDGHPENKYFESREAAASAPYVREDEDAQEYMVRYDFYGTVGQPIIQPNKYEYLQTLAYRLGRDIRKIAKLLSESQTADNIFRLQHEAQLRASEQLDKITRERVSNGGRDISLQKLARDLHKVAPDLAEELGVHITDDPASLTKQQAAQILQMQIIQESNNRWEMRFPEKENVWGFAAPRLTATAMHPRTKRVVPTKQHQFFDMRRWPPECQGRRTQTAIARSGPALQSRPEDLKSPTEKELENIRQQNLEQSRNLSKERHTGRGQRPYYPFGESRYTQGWLSFRMEDDLKNGKHNFSTLINNDSD